MRSVAILAVLLGGSVSAAKDTVQFSKSTYFNQHVTIIDRTDHYLIHFNVFVHLDHSNSDTMPYMHAMVLVGDNGLTDQLTVRRTVRLQTNEDTWSLYFCVPKFSTQRSKARYVANVVVDDVESRASVVWEVNGNQINLGSAEHPLVLTELVGAQKQEAMPDGSFRLFVVYETRTYTNNFESLPVTGFMIPGKAAPTNVDGERSARRLVNGAS